MWIAELIVLYTNFVICRQVLIVTCFYIINLRAAAELMITNYLITLIKVNAHNGVHDLIALRDY